MNRPTRSALKPAWRKVTLTVRQDRLDIVDALLRVVHRSRNSWLAELLDSGLPALAAEVAAKRRRLSARKGN